MSSKKAKAARKLAKNQNIFSNEFGTVLPGLKFVGKPLKVGFGVYDANELEEINVQNTEEFEFTGLEKETLFYSSVEELLNNVSPSESLSVVISVISDDSKLVEKGNGFTFKQPFDLLPFETGTLTLWRNPKLGHFLDEDREDVLQDKQKSAEFYETTFKGFSKVYKLEQVLAPAGWGTNLDSHIDKAIKDLLVS